MRKHKKFINFLYGVCKEWTVTFFRAFNIAMVKRRVIPTGCSVIFYYGSTFLFQLSVVMPERPVLSRWRQRRTNRRWPVNVYVIVIIAATFCRSVVVGFVWYFSHPFLPVSLTLSAHTHAQKHTHTGSVSQNNTSLL